MGTITLRVPRIRNGKFSTELFTRYQRSEQALVLAMMEMVVNGVSTRKVSQVTEELCGRSFSKSTESDLCKGLDPIITGWNRRPLSDNKFPFVLVDALYLKVREDGRVRSRGVMLAIGVNTDGHREELLGKKGYHATGVGYAVNDGSMQLYIKTSLQALLWMERKLRQALKKI